MDMESIRIIGMITLLAGAVAALVDVRMSVGLIFLGMIVSFGTHIIPATFHAAAAQAGHVPDPAALEDWFRPGFPVIPARWILWGVVWVVVAVGLIGISAVQYSHWQAMQDAEEVRHKLRAALMKYAQQHGIISVRTGRAALALDTALIQAELEAMYTDGLLDITLTETPDDVYVSYTPRAPGKEVQDGVS